jgi:hypothetical protein
MAESFKKIEKEKQESIAKTTKDSYIQNTILEMKQEDLIIFLASNPWLEETIQVKLATEDSFNLEVKTCLAKKIGLSIQVQKILATSEQVEVRRMLARWQRPTNPSIAKILIKDNDLEVRKTIALTIGESMSLENIIAFKTKEKGIDLQKVLIADEDSEVRGALASNENLTQESQMLLAKECYRLKEWNSLIWLVENKNLKLEVATWIQNNIIKEIPSFKKSSILKKIKEKKYLEKESTLLK